MKCKKKADDAPLPYERRSRSLAEWQQRLTATVREDALQLQGPCPACGHPLDDFVSLSPEWLKAIRRRADEPEQVLTVVTCNCDGSHANRPEGKLGCGASSVLTVALGGPAGEVTPSIVDARPATSRDSTWDDEATAWDKAKNERLSEVSEKWGATVAALFGLVGLGLILEGDLVAAVLTSDAEWPWWVLTGALWVIAATLLLYSERGERGEPADRGLLVAGGGATAAAVAALAFAAAGEIPVDAGTTFVILAAIAVGLALAATGFAGLAAQGSPKWVSYLTGNRMRRLRMESADASIRDLRRARVTTVLGIGALLATLAVLWYAPASDPGAQKVQLTTTDGTDPCGPLVANSGPGLALDPDGDEPRLAVPRADIVSVRPVDSCD